MTEAKPEFEWITTTDGHFYVPKGAGIERRVASLQDYRWAFIGDICIGKEMNKAQIERAFSSIASALATPASDGLPEGWKANAAQRGTGLYVYLSAGGEWFATHKGCGYSLSANVKSLSEACLAANERFPVVKPEAPAPKWKQDNQWCWQRSADRSLVHRMSDVVGLWGFIVSGKTLAAFPTAEEAMAWADRERPVA